MNSFNTITVKALLFDLDGTIVDNTPVHYKAWQSLAAEHGRELTPEIYKNLYSGKNTAGIFADVWRADFSEDQAKAAYARKLEIYTELLHAKDWSVKGFKRLHRDARSKSISTVLVSNASVSTREVTLAALGQSDIFDHIVGPEAGMKPKPAPDMYIHAVRCLGVEPEHCIVFEDSPIGIAAAKNAGMKVVALETTHRADELGEAEWVIKDFEDISLDKTADGIALGIPI